MPRPSRSSPRPVSSTRTTARRRSSTGLGLIELIVFIAIVGVAVAGVIVVYDRAVRASADPLVRKQALAVAESLLSEVLAQPLSYCDPQDTANDPAAPPPSTAACTGGAAASQDKGGGSLGPQPASESRFSATDPFDNVADYNGYAMASGIYSLDNGAVPVAGLDAYAATITVSRAGNALGLADDGDALRVDVLVSGRGETIALTGYRLRHSPGSTG